MSSGSPYWLLVNGAWLRLGDVELSPSHAADRPGSELVTVDGVRWVQRAPRAPRTWELDLSETELTTASVLAYVADSGVEAWLLDQTIARTNMLASRDCYGAGTLVDCAGLPLPALDLAQPHVVEVPVRAGVTYYVRAWGGQAGVTTLQADGPGAAATFTASVGWPANWPANWPSATVLAGSITPTANGLLTVTVTGPGDVAGLMVSESIRSVGFYASPGGTPCKVAVSDPTWSPGEMYPGMAARGNHSVILSEVG